MKLCISYCKVPVPMYPCAPSCYVSPFPRLATVRDVSYIVILSYAGTRDTGSSFNAAVRRIEIVTCTVSRVGDKSANAFIRRVKLTEQFPETTMMQWWFCRVAAPTVAAAEIDCSCTPGYLFRDHSLIQNTSRRLTLAVMIYPIKLISSVKLCVK